ncbi:hypothetical protein QG37_02928 [Candidozyma auris]|uniref:Uncharacterized protein n=1 Tax=Candidozyma auris TaxID=498019 RepID=A0A0L0P124_CANAR|nr:hypothetical protein QG37_02928 [[Candida] auris]
MVEIERKMWNLFGDLDEYIPCGIALMFALGQVEEWVQKEEGTRVERGEFSK